MTATNPVKKYKRCANYCLTQPLDLALLLRLVGTLEDVWLPLVKLPRA